MAALKRTPLATWHTENGARMVDFAGWEMPVQYEGIIKEHNHTRSQASLFDISHMGEFLVSGSGSLDALDNVVTQNLSTLGVGKCRYGFMLNERGGVIDDLILYRLEDQEFMLVVNGAREDIDYTWISRHLPEGVQLKNVSGETAKIDLQGPRALEALEAGLGGSWGFLKYFNFTKAEFEGSSMLVSRTGYTGELGYELYLPWNLAPALWERLAAVDFVKPAGLGARDTLRLELGYPLYGQDIDEEHTPIEAGFGFLMNKEADFIGKKGLDTVKEKLVPLTIEGRRSARTGDEVRKASGAPVGHVTSGAFSPSLGHAIALAYVEASQADNAAFAVATARTELDAKRTELPFYKEGTARTKTG
ncbi:glycine cleavage system aminomethyltransferase GcvT [Desulfohalovibrio reitneri]|uniref:glycine cleavage system aminomethyltransferase GcvT n=1 Tax=Desulfohalovibrio reitneri TaxID=1307759 RepID=UPI0004A78619|nr:glycine cleavage system aminomethyltransferase GcvT [Desulfohalovibrio reitneri]